MIRYASHTIRRPHNTCPSHTCPTHCIIGGVDVASMGALRSLTIRARDLCLDHVLPHTAACVGAERRVFWPNASWVKPYWSAAAYAVSQRGASGLLATYWPDAPHLSGATIDSRSQLWPAADQLLFNTSGAYLCAPLTTQPVGGGAHAEHA
eukprot:2491315-Prymnesium_polylepis.1